MSVPFVENPNLVRGLDYYNRSVFEWVSDDLGAQGTIAAGGRYDGLVRNLGGEVVPACGFAVGIERLLLELGTRYVEHARASRHPDVYLVHQGQDIMPYALMVATLLREQGLSVCMHGQNGSSFKSQMKKADQSGASRAVIVGDQEMERCEIVLKYLADGRQEIFSLDQLVMKLNVTP